MSTRPAGDGKLSETETATHPEAAALPPPEGYELLPEASVAATRELEFVIDPADAARLLRCPPILARRVGRVRNTPWQSVWHDTASGELARQGLAAAEARGGWRLERLVPNGVADWPPATPAPMLAEAQVPSELGADFPDTLMPVAAFTGRRLQLDLHDPSGPARVTILDGTVRGVSHDKPCCRLRLSGSGPAMAALALEIAESFDLGVPRAGLPAEAASVASGKPAGARQTGTASVPKGLLVVDALPLVAGHLADVILFWAEEAPQGARPEPVHQMRVAVRRLRSALSVFRRAAGSPGLRAISGELRALAGLLGAARDWDVFLAGTGAQVASALPQDRRIAAMIEAAGRKRRAAYLELGRYLGSAAWRRFALNLALLPIRAPWLAEASAEQASLLGQDVGVYAAGSLDRRLRHVLGAGEDLSALSQEALHEVRKQAKRLRYAIEFFAPLYGAKPVRKYLERLESLQEALGSVNDQSVAGALMGQLGDRAFASGAVQGFVAARSSAAIEEAGRAWRKFYRLEGFWD